MAHPEAAAFPAHITLTRIVDAIDDIACCARAFKVVEDLITPQKSNNREDLSHVDRADFGFLMTILNVSLQQQIDKAKALADEAHEAGRDGQ